jgi:DNA-directed RNA polymerase
MPTIEPHIKNYIDTTVVSLEQHLGDRFDKRVDKAIEKTKKEFSAEMKRHTSALVEGVNNKAKEIEIVAKKLPSEERIRDIFREEINPLDIKLNICLSEIMEHRKELDRHEDRIESLELEAV